jgi:hypothetical protein
VSIENKIIKKKERKKERKKEKKTCDSVIIKHPTNDISVDNGSCIVSVITTHQLRQIRLVCNLIENSPIFTSDSFGNGSGSLCVCFLYKVWINLYVSYFTHVFTKAHTQAFTK